MTTFMTDVLMAGKLNERETILKELKTALALCGSRIISVTHA